MYRTSIDDLQFPGVVRCETNRRPTARAIDGAILTRHRTGDPMRGKIGLQRLAIVQIEPACWLYLVLVLHQVVDRVDCVRYVLWFRHQRGARLRISCRAKSVLAEPGEEIF